MYSAAKIAPALSIQFGFCILLTSPVILGTVPYFLAAQVAPGSFCIFSPPVFNIITFPRSPGSFSWIMVFRKQELDARGIPCC